MTTATWDARHSSSTVLADSLFLRMLPEDRDLLRRLWYAAPFHPRLHTTACHIRAEFIRLTDSDVPLGVVFAAQPWDLPAGDPDEATVAALAKAERENRPVQGMTVPREDRREPGIKRCRWRGLERADKGLGDA